MSTVSSGFRPCFSPHGASRIVGAGVIAVAAIIALSAPARATLIETIPDTYIGSDDTIPGHGVGQDAEVIGAVSDFGITSVGISYAGADLQIDINTFYAGKSGLDGTTYGSLFITPGVNLGPPNVYAANPASQWTYAATIGPGGSSGLYLTSDGTVSQSQDLINSAYWYFRSGQPVVFNPGINAVNKAPGSTWSISTDTISFLIKDGGLIGNDFALSWAMSCANDVIWLQFDGPARGDTPPVPLPAAFPLFAFAVGGLGLAGRGRRRRAAAL